MGCCSGTGGGEKVELWLLSEIERGPRRDTYACLHPPVNAVIYISQLVYQPGHTHT
jgi:hypothetical protein